MPFERDDEGEQLLGHLLAGQWDQHPSTMDVDMDQGSESRNKRKAGNSEPSEDAGDEVFGEYPTSRGRGRVVSFVPDDC